MLKAWLDTCEVSGQLRSAIEGIWKLARVKDGGPVRVWFVSWVDAEGKAHRLRVWQPIIFPGLVQTPDYAFALFTATGMDKDRATEQVEMRMARQSTLDRPDPPSLVIVLDELVLHRLIGAPEIMREQIAHLIELSQRPNVMIHILPGRTGANAGLGGPVQLAMGTGTPEVLLVGTLNEDQLTADPGLVRRASATFDAVRGDALNRADSRNLIMEALQRWNS